MPESNEPMRTHSDADQEPPVTTPPPQETQPGGTIAPDDPDARDGGEDIKDTEHRSTAFDNAKNDA